MHHKIDIKTGKIIIIDDEPKSVEVIERILLMDGYTNIIATSDPEKGMQICIDDEQDLLILDLNMPHTSGFDILARFKNTTNIVTPFILVLSGLSTINFKRQALDSGARDFIAKPYDVTEFLVRIRNLLETKLLHNYMRNQNLILEELVHKRTEDLLAQTADMIKIHNNLQKTRLQVVQRLGRAAEYRDNETGFHIIRVSYIARILASKTNMSKDEIELILNATPMHDIGKIGIPDNVLLKHGKLSESEWKIMQTHTTIGADILSGDDTDLMQMASKIALSHHEKWDGSGYPHGLNKKQIPLPARICAIADVFDALTSNRPYKKAWNTQDALDLINQESGKHFDPNLVTLFNNNFEEINAIKKQYVEPDNAVIKERLSSIAPSIYEK